MLHPFTISRTDLGHNPHPLIVVWAGPVIGALLPLIVFLLAKLCRSPGIYLFRFFAGFCLVTNGVYISVGSFQGVMDAGDVLRHGSPQWLLIVFGALTVPLGLYLWHGIGEKFGLGKAEGRVSRSATLVALSLFVLVFVLEMIFGSRW